jgi:vacuolar-type H+-ATPase subunit E/Vma4
MLTTSLALTVLCVAVPVIYVSGSREDARQASNAAELASFENARDEWTRCQQRVVTSAQLAAEGAAARSWANAVDLTFQRILDLVDDPAEEPTEAALELRRIVEDMSAATDVYVQASAVYEAVDPSTCPAEPVPPGSQTSPTITQP